MVKSLGLSVGATSVHGVLLRRGTIVWAGSTAYTSPAELTDAIARLAGESGCVARTTRVVLARDVVQLRTILPAPPLKPSAARRYLALEAARLFRKNGAPLVTDAVAMPTAEKGLALFAAAAPQPLLDAIIDGCKQAGLRVQALAPAADVLAASLAAIPAQGEVTFLDGETAEVLSIGPQGAWRSRLQAATGGDTVLQWAEPLRALHDEAPHYAAAYAAARQPPRLELWPPETRRLRTRDSRRKLIRLTTAGLVCWALAVGVYVGRLLAMLYSSTHYLNAVSGQLDSALALRRDLDAGGTTLATIATARSVRSRTLELLGHLATALPDSAVILSLTLGADGIVRLGGRAASAARVVAVLEQVKELRDVKLEGPVTREAGTDGRPLDRLAIVARLEATR